MKDYSIKHPVLFGILLIVAAFLAAGILSALLTALGLSPEMASAAARILVAVVLMLLFREIFPAGCRGRGFLWCSPALIFVVWNIVYNLINGSEFAGAGALGSALLLCLAPALFEETIFRGILISRLRAGGYSPMKALLISAALFAVTHLTNAVSGDVASVLVQVGYSFVVGLLFGAVYLKTGDLLSVMLFHALVDFTDHLFVSLAHYASLPMIIAFAIMLVFVAVYSIQILPRKSREDILSTTHPPRRMGL